MSERIGGLIRDIGAFYLFFVEIIRTGLHTRPKDLRAATFEQLSQVAIRSLPTVAFAGLFVGAILVLQFQSLLAKYQAEALLGGLTSSSIIREIGPLIISFLLAGKVGAYTAAELGTMRITEQIDAIRCLGTNPIRFLILPRFLAIIISSVILLTLALMVSLAGAAAMAYTVSGVNLLQFRSTIPQFVGGWIFISGLIKCAFYGLIVALVACKEGFTATGGAIGVGRAVTRSAVYTNFLIILAQFILSPLLAWIGTFFQRGY